MHRRSFYSRCRRRRPRRRRRRLCRPSHRCRPIGRRWRRRHRIHTVPTRPNYTADFLVRLVVVVVANVVVVVVVVVVAVVVTVYLQL